MSECQHCSLTPEEHKESAAQTIEDFAMMALVITKFPELSDSVNRVVDGWRGHALPECDPLSVS